MAVKQIDHVTINIRDLDKTREFYGKLLEFEELPTIDLGDHVLYYYAIPGGGKMELTQFLYEVPSGQVDSSNLGVARHLAFEVDDINALEKKLNDAGYHFHCAIGYVEKLGATGGLVRDPNGFELEFLQKGRHR